MIVYIEQEILLDTQCRDLYLCNNELNDEYLIISSIDQCSCKKQRVILCKYEHDQCENRCLIDNDLFLKQKSQSNEILINNHPINVVLLENNELKNNAEIVYICQENNLPKSIYQHLKNQLTLIDPSPINRVRRMTFFEIIFFVRIFSRHSSKISC
jgi:hypothetical protein